MNETPPVYKSLFNKLSNRRATKPGEIRKTLADFERDFPDRPVTIDDLCKLGEKCHHFISSKVALNVLSVALERFPEASEIHSMSGYLHMLNHDLDKAVASLDKALEYNPENPQALVHRAQINARVHHVLCYKDAIGQFEKASPSLQPPFKDKKQRKLYVQVMEGLCQSYLGFDRWQDAVDAGKEWQKYADASDNFHGSMRLAIAYIKCGDLDEAFNVADAFAKNSTNARELKGALGIQKIVALTGQHEEDYNANLARASALDNPRGKQLLDTDSYFKLQLNPHARQRDTEEVRRYPIDLLMGFATLAPLPALMERPSRIRD